MEELNAKLQEVMDAAKEQFPGAGAADRLLQLQAHIATCQMIVEHLFDESTRMEGYK